MSTPQRSSHVAFSTGRSDRTFIAHREAPAHRVGGHHAARHRGHGGHQQPPPTHLVHRHGCLHLIFFACFWAATLRMALGQMKLEPDSFVLLFLYALGLAWCRKQRRIRREQKAAMWAFMVGPHRGR